MFFCWKLFSPVLCADKFLNCISSHPVFNLSGWGRFQQHAPRLVSRHGVRERNVRGKRNQPQTVRYNWRYRCRIACWHQLSGRKSDCNMQPKLHFSNWKIQKKVSVWTEPLNGDFLVCNCDRPVFIRWWFNTFLQPAIAKAWKVITTEPIIVRLHLSLSSYLDASGKSTSVHAPTRTVAHRHKLRNRKIRKMLNWNCGPKSQNHRFLSAVLIAL